MGDNLVLLTQEKEESVEEIVELNKDWFKSLFKSIVP